MKEIHTCFNLKRKGVVIMTEKKMNETEEEKDGEIRFEKDLDTEAMDVVTRLYDKAFKELVER